MNQVTLSLFHLNSELTLLHSVCYDSSNLRLLPETDVFYLAFSMLTECESLQNDLQVPLQKKLLRLIVISESKVIIKLLRLSVFHMRCSSLSGIQCPAPPTQ